ncbi:lipocalin Cav p 3.0101-like [Acomys russatus]|uniref:lipocalin Cav p 3.0101-like n=1 Tax=Acomys russatus TaxID=60746 RepID=UPI0021E1D32E|nr:lipocalin Cav p 3.0101-like [Acomys russatus]
MKVLLLALVLASICSRNRSNGQLNATQISGDWHTIAIAATDIDLITDDGMLKLFFRHFECTEQCLEIILTFYGEVDEECEKFEVKAQRRYSNTFSFIWKGDSVSGEEQQKFTDKYDEMLIPKENIRYLLEKDYYEIQNICSSNFSMAIDSPV